MTDVDEKQVLSVIQRARESGKVVIGINQVTKALERAQAKLVICAVDVNPAELIAHLEPLCKDMKAGYLQLGNKKELGDAAGIHVGTSSIAVVDAGSAKKDLDMILKELLGDIVEEKEAVSEEKVKEAAPKEAAPKEAAPKEAVPKEAKKEKAPEKKAKEEEKEEVVEEKKE